MYSIKADGIRTKHATAPRVQMQLPRRHVSRRSCQGIICPDTAVKAQCIQMQLSMHHVSRHRQHSICLLDEKCQGIFPSGHSTCLTGAECHGVTNLVRQAPWRRRWCHSHPCRPVARSRFRCRSHGPPPRLGASTDLRHIAPVAISLTNGRSRPLSFVSIMLLACPSPVIVTYVVLC